VKNVSPSERLIAQAKLLEELLSMLRSPIPLGDRGIPFPL
jgi:hypothetical protein